MDDKIKRFLVFAGDTYYPTGGWSDYRCSFDTEKEALKWLARYNYDWNHIVDMQTGKTCE